MTPTAPNTDQITAWNTTSGSTWVALQERLDAQLERAGLDALDRLDVRVGERVLDVGCGCGASSLELQGGVPGAPAKACGSAYFVHWMFCKPERIRAREGAALDRLSPLSRR